MRGRAALLLVTAGCVGAEFVRQPDQRPCAETVRPAPSPSAEALEVGSALSAFVAAVERRDFERAYALLDGASRRRYSPARLEADFALEPRGAALVGRLKAALGRPITVSGGRATLVVAEGRVAAAVHESDGWHVQSLDDALSVK